MRAEALLGFEFENGESGSLGERTKFGYLRNPDVAVAHEAGQGKLDVVHKPYHEVVRRVVTENQTSAGAKDARCL